MTERQRATGTKESQSLPSIRTGIEGFADGMRIFPRLKEWENQIALQALREGKTVQDLQNMTPFRQYVGVARRTHLAGEHSPFSSFTSLFAESPSIDMLVSLGNFHTIRTWTWIFAKQYPDLNLPLEQFFQDALYQIAPYSAQRYDPSIGNPFHHFLTELLKKRFRTFVTSFNQEITAPITLEETPQTQKGRSVESSERVKIASLDAPMRNTETPQTLFEFVDQTRHAPPEKRQAEDWEVRQKIQLLACLAGLNEPQEQTLVAHFFDESKTQQISHMRRCTTRSVRLYKQTALSKIAQLGYETVQAVLTGEYPTPAGVQENGQAR